MKNTNTQDHPYDMAIRELQKRLKNLEELREEQRIAEIKSCFSQVLLLLKINEALHYEKTSSTEIINMIKKCAKQNNINLKKIKVDCFNKKNANSALKKYIKFDSADYNEEFQKLLKLTEEYIITNGYID